MVDFSNNTLDYVDYTFDITDISNNPDVSYNNFSTNNLYQTTYNDVQYINIVSNFVGQVLNKINIPVTTIQEVLLYKKNGTIIETDISSGYLQTDGSGVLILEKTVRVFVESYFSQEEINTTYINKDVAWLIDAYTHLDSSYDTTNVRKTILDRWKNNSMHLLHRELTNIYRTEINAFLSATPRGWSFQLPPSIINNKSKVTNSIDTNGNSIHYSQYRINKTNTKMSCSDFIIEGSNSKLIGEVKDVSSITMDNRKKRIITMITDLLQTDKCRRLILEQIPSVPDASSWTSYPIKAGDILQFGNITVPLPSVDLSNNLYTPETTSGYGFILYNYLEKTLSTYIDGLTADNTSNNCISAGTFISYADPSDNNVSFSEYQLDNLDTNIHNKIHLKNRTVITYYSYAVNIVADKTNTNFNNSIVSNGIVKLNNSVNSNNDNDNITINIDGYEQLKMAESNQNTENVSDELIGGGTREINEKNLSFYEIAIKRYNDEERHEFNLSMMLQIAMGDLLGHVVGSVLPGSPAEAIESAFNTSGLGDTVLAGNGEVEEAFDLLQKLEAYAQSLYVSSSMWKVLGYIVNKLKINVNNSIYLLKNLHNIIGKFILDMVNSIWDIFKGLFNSLLDIAESMLMIIYPTVNNLKGLVQSVVDLTYGPNGYITTISNLLKTFTINIMHILLDVFIDGNDTTNYSGIPNVTPTKNNGDYITSPRDRFDYLSDEMFAGNLDDEIKGLYYSTASATAKPGIGEQFSDTKEYHSYNMLIEVGLYFMLQIYTLMKMASIIRDTITHIVVGDFGNLNLEEVLINVLRFVLSCPSISEIYYAFGEFITSADNLINTTYSTGSLGEIDPIDGLNNIKILLSNVCIVASDLLYFLFTMINPSTSLFDEYGNFFQGVIKGIGTIVNFVGDVVEDAVVVVGEFFEDVTLVVDAAWDAVANALGIDREAVEAFVTDIAEAIVGAIIDAVEFIGDGLKAIQDGIRDIGKSAVALANAAYNDLNDTFGKKSIIYNEAVKAYDYAKKELVIIGKDILDVGKKLANIANEWLKANKVIESVERALNDIADWFGDIWKSFECSLNPAKCRRDRNRKNAVENAKKNKAEAAQIKAAADTADAEALKSSLQSQKESKINDVNAKQSAKEVAEKEKNDAEKAKTDSKNHADDVNIVATINDTIAQSKTSLIRSFQEVLSIIFKMNLRNIKHASNDTTFAYKPINQFNIANGIYNNVYVYEISGNTYATTTDDNNSSYNYLRDNFVLAVKNKTPAYPVNTMFYKLNMASTDIPERETKIKKIGTLEKQYVENSTSLQPDHYFYKMTGTSKDTLIISEKHYKYKVPLFTAAYPNDTTIINDADYFYISKDNWTQLKTAVNTDIYRSVYAFNKG